VLAGRGGEKNSGRLQVARGTDVGEATLYITGRVSRLLPGPRGEGIDLFDVCQDSGFGVKSHVFCSLLLILANMAGAYFEGEHG